MVNLYDMDPLDSYVSKETVMITDCKEIFDFFTVVNTLGIYTNRTQGKK